jgi:hypothetical protein
MYFLRVVIVHLIPLSVSSTQALSASAGIRESVGVRPPVTPDVQLWSDPTSEIVPQCVFDPEPVCEDSPLFQAVLHSELGHSSFSTVYSLGEEARSGRVIKYNAFCQGDDLALGNFPSPIDLETHFLQILNMRAPGVTITHVFSSEAIAKPAGNGKFHYPPPTCKSGAPTLVQYMIMERAGPTLKAYLKQFGKLDVLTVASMGLQLIRLLRRIHALGIVHADLHPGNIAITHETPRRLILIDFGFARYGTDSLHEGGFGPLFCNPHFTIWEARGGDGTYRDDVTRVVQLMAVLLYGRTYLEALQALCERDPNQYLSIKEGSDWFNTEMIFRQKTRFIRYTKSVFLLSQSVAAKDVPRVRSLLREIQSMVQSLREPNQIPQYYQIERTLVDIISVFRTIAPGEDPAAINFMEYNDSEVEI